MEANKYIQKGLIAVLFMVRLLLFSPQVEAQSQMTFTGRILDSQTHEPLPFATITQLRSQTSVVSNEFGEFQYHLPNNSPNSVVQISFIGYKTIKLNVSEIRSGILTIYKMEPQIQQLQQVDITPIKIKTPAVNIVNKAIRNIRKNYPRDKTLLYGYYRDYISPRLTHEYKNLIEAAVVIEDRGVQTDDYDKTKIKIEQLRFNPTVAVDSFINLDYDYLNKFIPNATLCAENELYILRAHDPIRNHKTRTFSFVNIMDLNFTANHQFHIEAITEVDSVKTYCIGFNKYFKDYIHHSDYQVDGEIVINSKTYAILKFNYRMTCNTPTYSGKFLNIKLEYKNLNDQYYLNYLSFMNYFVFKNDPSASRSVNINETFFQYRELFINKIVNKPFEDIPTSEAIKKDSSLFVNKIPEIKDFWENYNCMGISKLLE